MPAEDTQDKLERPMNPKPKFFMAYGSIMRCYNPSFFKDAKFEGYGHTEAGLGHGYSRLRMFDNGVFPYVIRDDSFGYLIWGELYSNISDKDWNIIDKMERAAGYELQDAGGFFCYSQDKWIYGAKMWIYKDKRSAKEYQEVLSGSWRELAMQGGVSLSGE